MENSNGAVQGWEDVNLKDVNPQFDLVPENVYTFRVVSAGPHKYAEGAINLGLAIESEGESRGRRVFSKLKPPAEDRYAAKKVKRIEVATGIDSNPGEPVLEYLQRLAAEGGRFQAPLTHFTFVNKETGENNTIETVNLLNPRPAA